MTDHKGLPVHGYNPQPKENTEIVNNNKILEESCIRVAESIRDDERFDPRMSALAITKLQEAFMWLNRAVFQPSRVKLPEDK
jgi:hypothetical protein